MQFITKEYLRNHLNFVFIFGDNLDRKGKRGAATLRDEPNTFGFITKKHPDNLDSSFYKPKEYKRVFTNELTNLLRTIESNTNVTFLVSKLGAGLTNRYKIWEKIIQPGLEQLKPYPNVKLLYDE